MLKNQKSGLIWHIWHLISLLWLILVLQYMLNPFFMVVKILVSKHDSFFVVNLLEPAVKRCLNGVLCSLGVQYK